jgi:site-specific recombinase XerD
MGSRGLQARRYTVASMDSGPETTALIVLETGSLTVGALTENAMSRIHVWQMIQRRAPEAGVSGDICCHTFRATGITTYLDNGGTLENAQIMAAHESPRTTKLYDRTGDEITLDEVERIVI